MINPLRIDQMGLVGDGLDNYREPLWIAKALWHGGDLPGITSVDVEAFYSPDGRPLSNKLILGNGWRMFDNLGCFPEPLSCERPHQLPFDRIRHPWEIERVGPYYSQPPDQGDLGLESIREALGLPDLAPNGGLGKADFLYLVDPRYGDRTHLARDGWKEIDPERGAAAKPPRRQWFLTVQFFNEYWAHVDGQLGQDFSVTNRHQHWNPVLTWIMTGFFDKSRLRPTIAYAYEVDTQFQTAWLQAQYYVLPDLQLRVGAVLYMGSFRDENFLLLNDYASRDTTYLRLTYFLL